MPPPPATVDDLGLQGCLALWALLTARERRLRVAPTRAMTVQAMSLLQKLGIIEVPWPLERWAVSPEAHETPIEGLQWRLNWSAYQPALLAGALEDYLEAVESDDWAQGMRLRLWSELAAGEAEQFFEQQLVKHHLPAEWSLDLGFVHRRSASMLSLSQWRYCAWAAVRRGAALTMQRELPTQHVRDAIFQEIGRRALAVASGAWERCALPPLHTNASNAFARGFLRLLAPIGEAYWNRPPNLDTIIECNKA